MSRLDLVWIDGVCYDADAYEVGRRAGLERAAELAHGYENTNPDGTPFGVYALIRAELARKGKCGTCTGSGLVPYRHADGCDAEPCPECGPASQDGAHR